MKTHGDEKNAEAVKTDELLHPQSPGKDPSGSALLHKLILATEKKNKDQHPVAATILCDLQGNVKETDIAKDSEINLSGKDFVGMNIFSFLDEELRKTAFQHFQKVKQNGKASGIRHVKLINGEIRSFEIKNIAVYDGDKPVAVRIFVWDVTHQIKEKQSFLEREACYRGVFENTGLPIVILEENLVISMVNVGFEKLSGYGRGEIEEKIRLTQFIDKETGERIGGLFHKDSGNSRLESECRLTNRNGQIFDMLVRFDKIASAKLMIATFIDITAQKRVETELKKREGDLRKEVDFLKSSLKIRSCFAGIIGKSSEMQHVYEEIANAAEVQANVIIYGESGTGKELVARAIHKMSCRKDNNFIAVNCGAIPEHIVESEFFGYKKGAFTGAFANKPGYLDHADGGTLFLDEVGELSLTMQVKLLRVIDGSGFIPLGSNEMKKTDLRIIAATNRDLEKLIGDDSFREDFFYRIHIITINLPPLRERKEDIPLLIDHFTKIHGGNGRSGISGKLLDQFMDYDWPGNVRELENVIQRYLSMKKFDFTEFQTRRKYKEQKKTQVPKTGKLQDIMASYEKEIIRNALAQFNWHQGQAAAALGINRKTLFVKMKKMGLERPKNKAI